VSIEEKEEGIMGHEKSDRKPNDAFDLWSGEGSQVHPPLDSALGFSLQLVPALLGPEIRVRGGW